MANMCIPNTLQHNILEGTNGGYDIARFLAETMRGETLGVKVNHRLDAAKHLIRYGFPDAQCDINRPIPQEKGTKTPSPSMGEGWDGGDISVSTEPVEPHISSPSMSVPVSHLDILNYEIAHLIRSETAEGHTIVKFLAEIMTGRDRPFTPKKLRIKPADRMAAARELLRRGFGDFGYRRKLSDSNDEANAYDTLHTDLAKRMREYSEHGTDTIRFLLEVMANPDPEEGFTVHHRMSAAQELLRRGWETNYDRILSEDVAAYWQDQTSPRLSVGQKKQRAGMSAYVDEYDIYDDLDYDAIARQLRVQGDHEAAANETERRTITPSPSTGEGWDGGEISLPSSPSISDRAFDLNLSKDAEADNASSAPNESNKKALTEAEGKKAAEQSSNKKENEPHTPNDPAPEFDLHYEPLTPEQQAKFDAEWRRNSDLTKRDTHPLVRRKYTDPLVQRADAALVHGGTAIPISLGDMLPFPDIRSP